MNTFLSLFIVAMCSSLVLTPLIRRLCRRLKWLDVPEDERRVHVKSVPRLGGIALYLSVLISLLTLLFVDNLLTRALLEDITKLRAVLVTTTIIFLFGVYDDMRGSSARLKFLVQGLAGALLLAMGDGSKACPSLCWKHRATAYSRLYLHDHMGGGDYERL